MELEEFMEAEERRKRELGGEDPSDGSETVLDEVYDHDKISVCDLTFAHHSSSSLLWQRSTLKVLGPDHSDDELGNWDVLDASNLVYAVDGTSKAKLRP
jgi:hypothetical protein